MKPTVLPLAVLLAVVGCVDTPLETGLTAPEPPIAFAPDGGCAGSPNFVATDEVSLTAALQAAADGDVVAVQGTVELTMPARIETDGLTLVCASPGSGLAVAPAAVVSHLLLVEADRITLRRLVLDASAASNGAVLVGEPDPLDPAEEVQISDNEVTCGLSNCVFLSGTPRALIARNRFTAPHPIGTGVHLQGKSPGTHPFPLPHLVRIDGSRVERNVVIAEVAGPASAFGGIRVRDGSDVLVEKNTVQGAWWNGVSAADLAGSVIGHNDVEGARTGLLTTTTRGIVEFRENDVRNNRVTGSAQYGVDVNRSCANRFWGNHVSGSGAGTAIFRPQTGANVWRGNGQQVVDLGAFDCDGDSQIDPNST